MSRLIAIIPLAAIAFIDCRTRQIPDQLTALVVLCGLCNIVGNGIAPIAGMLGGILIGGLILVYSLCTDAIGGGDVKLCAALGLLLGAAKCLSLLFLALLAMLLLGKAKHAKSLPLGPFLFGAYLLIFWR